MTVTKANSCVGGREGKEMFGRSLAFSFHNSQRPLHSLYFHMNATSNS